MSALIPFLAFDQSCEQVEAWVIARLSSAGLRVVRTFDLHVARLAHSDCPCPNHGTNDCDCQMVVFLVYYKHENPATLVIHSQDGRAWISLAGPVGKRANQHLAAAIRRALIPNRTDNAASIEVVHEAQATA